MSSFRQKVAKSLLALTLSVGLLAGVSAPTFADTKDDIRKKRSSVNKKLNAAKKDVKNSQARFESAAQKLKASQQRLASAKSKLRSTKGQLVVAEAENERLRAELAASEAKLDAAEKNVVTAEKSLNTSQGEVERFTVESVMQGDSGLRAFGGLLKGEDPNTFTERVSAQTSVSDAQLARMQELDASRVLLEVERAAFEALRDQVAKQKAQAEAHVAQMADLTAQAAAQEQAVSSLVDENSKARRDANAALKEDQAIQAQFEREDRALEQELQRIIEAERRKTGTTNPPPTNNSSTLSRPVTGRISSQYGMRRHPIYGSYRMHSGTDFAAPCGRPIWAAANGTVVRRSYAGGYGNHIVVNHGTMRGVNVMTSYSHLSRFNVSNGQRVTRGQVIGYVGTTGASTGCHLHFMVYRNGQHTNPMNWL